MVCFTLPSAQWYCGKATPLVIPFPRWLTTLLKGTAIQEFPSDLWYCGYYSLAYTVPSSPFPVPLLLKGHSLKKTLFEERH